MIASAVCEDGRRGLLAWVLPVSAAAHVLVFVLAPSSRRIAARAPLPLVVELAELPPAPPPAPRTEPTPSSPAPEAPRAVALSSPAPPSRGARSVAPSPTPASEAPMDFTSTLLSNEGPGMAIGGSPGLAAAPAPSSLARSASPVAPRPVRVVPASSLARRPRAFGLDAELERQYPVDARRSGISGSAVLRVRILPDGRVGDVRAVSESWAGFGPACERTVRAARWDPPIDGDGTPVATEITYTCRFEIRS